MKRITLVFIALSAIACAAWAQDASAPAPGEGRKAPQLTDSDKAVDATAATEQTGPSAEVLAALNTPKDSYGIPAGLYPLDLQLGTYRSSIKTGESNATLFGILGGVCVGGGVALALGVPELVWAPYGSSTGIPYGYFVAGVGGGILVFDLVGVIPGISKNKKEMLGLYKEKYGQ